MGRASREVAIVEKKGSKYQHCDECHGGYLVMFGVQKSSRVWFIPYMDSDRGRRDNG